MFEINTRSILAFTYNDKSVLENYHLYVFFNILSNNFLNIFENFNETEIRSIRKIFIANVIATDMTLHKQEIKKINELLAKQDFDPKKQENKDYIMTHLVHFADISNPTKNFDIYKIWVDKIFAEFFGQGDKEKELNLPVSFNCDRQNTNIPKGQIFFIDFFVKEQINVLVLICPNCSELNKKLEENKKKWDEIKNEPYTI